MEISARIFGLNSWSLLVPQALEGVATVGVLYATVRRWFGPAAGHCRAVLAVTPVAALMFRYDNPDALLVLLLVLAAYTITRALDGQVGTDRRIMRRIGHFNIVLAQPDAVAGPPVRRSVR